MDKAALDSLLERLREAREKQASPTDDAWKGVANAGAVGLGLGLGTRGVMGLISLLKSRSIQHRKGPAVVPLPYVPSPPHRREKAAEGEGWGESIKNWAQGQSAATANQVPWGGAAQALALLGGASLGFHTLGKGLDTVHEHETQRDLDAARDEFNAALMSQHPNRDREKKAQDGEIGPMLDAIYDRLEKSGSILGDIALNVGGGVRGAAGELGGHLRSGIGYAAGGARDAANSMFEGATGVTKGQAAGQLANMYGWWAVPAALAGGTAAYNWQSGRGRRALLDKALKERERERQRYSPPELLAMPMPVKDDKR